MIVLVARLSAAALVLACGALPVSAGSLVGSSAAGGSSASSLGSASSEASSDSSSHRRTAATWRITDVAVLADPAGAVRLTLERVPADGDAPAAGQGAAAASTHALVLPADTAARHQLAVGRLVATQPQPYGIAYAALGGPAFFLVLDDGWQRELDARPVQL
jgi:hypothetical protein